MSEAADTTPTVHTYHCICTTLILSSQYLLDSLPQRDGATLDGALILPIPIDSAAQDDSLGNSILHNIYKDSKPVIIRREDGFEKRILLRCDRCELIVGYKLDTSQRDVSDDGEQIVYILPGGLVNTESMKAGKAASTPAWAQKT